MSEKGRGFKRIIGFRSGTKWKMIVTCFIYLTIIGGITGAFSGGNKNSQQATANVEKERKEAIETAQKEEKENAEEEKKKQEKEIKTATPPVEKKEESIEDKVKNVVNKKFEEKKVQSIQVNDNLGTENPNDKMVLITAEGKENVTANFSNQIKAVLPTLLL
ncbi:hypothetical protein CN391_05210 [Bacillus anthracis]|nr:hypothetical protein CN391_05210 [Bacillus anthracis]